MIASFREKKSGKITKGEIFTSDANCWYVKTEDGDVGISRSQYDLIPYKQEAREQVALASSVLREWHLSFDGPILSKNRMYVVVRNIVRDTGVSGKPRRVRSSAYNKFRTRIIGLAEMQVTEPITGSIEVSFFLYAPKFYKNGNRKKYDAANIIDAMLDTLVEGGIIEDDRYIERLTLDFYDSQEFKLDVVIRQRGVTADAEAT